MPTAAANLKTRYDAIASELATIASVPITYKSDAGGTRKGELESYRLQLMAELKAILELLKAMGFTVDENGDLVSGALSFEVPSVGY